MPCALCPMPYALCPMPYAYALCPMPYALCPMPYAVRVPHMRARKAILCYYHNLRKIHRILLIFFTLGGSHSPEQKSREA